MHCICKAQLSGPSSSMDMYSFLNILNRLNVRWADLGSSSASYSIQWCSPNSRITVRVHVWVKEIWKELATKNNTQDLLGTDMPDSFTQPNRYDLAEQDSLLFGLESPNKHEKKKPSTPKDWTREERFVPFRHFGANIPLLYASKTKINWDGDEKGEKMYLATDYEKREGRTGGEEDDRWLEFEGFSGALSNWNPPSNEEKGKQGRWWGCARLRDGRSNHMWGREGGLCKEKPSMWCLGSLGRDGCAMRIFYRKLDVYRCKEKLWLLQ